MVENLRASGMRFGTTRKSRRGRSKGGGFAPQALRSVRAWAEQFDVPLLQLTPIDTISQLVLNPTQLTSVQAAQTIAARTDSLAPRAGAGFQQLDIAGTVDTARRLAALRAPTKALGLDGTRKAIEDAARRSNGWRAPRRGSMRWSAR